MPTNLYAGADDGEVRLLDENLNDEGWSHTESGGWIEDSATDGDGNSYHVDRLNNTVIKVDSTGSEVWQSSVPDLPLSVTTDNDNGWVYVGTYSDEEIIRYSQSDGSQKWRSVTGPLGGLRAIKYDGATGDIFYAGGSTVGRETPSSTGTSNDWYVQPVNDSWSITVNNDEGYLYAGITSGYLSKIAKDGTIVWEEILGEDTESNIEAKPNDGCVFQDDAGWVKSIAGDGTVNWSYNTGSATDGSVTRIGSNTYAGTGTGEIIKLDNTGALVSSNTTSFSTTVDTLSQVFVAPPEPPFYYTGDEDGILKQFQADDTETLSDTTSSNAIWDVAAKTDGSTIFTTHWSTGYVRAFDNTGTQLWQYDNNSARGIEYDEANGYVYAGRGFGVTTKLNASDGSFVNDFSGSLGGTVQGTAVDGSGNIYSGDEDGIVSKFSPDGTEQWTDSRSGQIYEVDEYDGTLIVCWDDGVIRYYNLDGTLQTEYTGGANIHGAGISADGVAGANWTNNEVIHLDLSGNEVWRASLDNTAYDADMGENGVVYATSNDGIYEFSSTGTRNFKNGYTSGVQIRGMEFVEAPVTVEKITASQTAVTGTMNSASAQVPLEKISASNTISNATTNGATATFKKSITATPTPSVGTASVGSVSISQPTTSVSTAVTVNSPQTHFTEPIGATPVASVASSNSGAISAMSQTATPISAVGDSNVGSVTASAVSAQNALSAASMNGTGVEATFFVNATVTPVTASQNDAGVSSLTVDSTPFTADAFTQDTSTLEIFEAIQTDVVATTNTPDTKFAFFADATQFTSTSDTLTGVPYFTAERDATQVDVAVSPLPGVAEDFTFATSQQINANSRKSVGKIRYLRYTRFDNKSTSTLNNSKNSATIKANVNEVK